MAKLDKTGEMARLFAALADPTRLRLLNLMDGREVCVCYFVQVLKQSQPKISRHLAYLRQAGVVSARREGKWMHYRMTKPEDVSAQAVLTAVMQSCKTNAAMQADLERMKKASCAPQKYVMLAGAPVPAKCC
jgi:ArsR family transcriptional regulator